ncbi:helix-turn-helix domain-containing protein [Streptomyces sp. VNUA24]|uniref:helix-turn-helix domain-containing protein n=1 Tax=Streptomyces sp. VNUA24 TaxID=3031131 RepID=UPI0023B86BA6|nr:helix-turn-helix domain-containing protein [Streptomyces sp. VNUA24]WEH16516.1 helix-turn-helix domain-containing protein [Streptomyces sp. VNUA24]
MTADSPLHDRLDDDDYPAYTMGRAAAMLGTTPAFLRALGEARLITPLRSEGGHRRYSRYQLRIAARARELVDRGTPIEAACRIVILEDQLEEAQRLNAEYRRRAGHEAPDGSVSGALPGAG